MALLIVDACVLIDLFDADPSVLPLISEAVGELHVVEPVLDEIKQLDTLSARELGLVVVQPTLEEAVQAGAAGGALSFEDWLCVYIAGRLGLTCVTNDKRLRAECGAHNISVVWGLELVAETHEAGALDRQEAMALAKTIASNNPFITPAVLKRFADRVGKTRNQKKH